MARFFQPKKKTQFETKHQSVLVERMDHNGAGIAYQKNKGLRDILHGYAGNHCVKLFAFVGSESNPMFDYLLSIDR